MLNFGKSGLFRYILLRAFHRSRTQHKFETHYDVLRLKKNCSSKEIRDAFVNLSKQFHPDVKQDNVEMKNQTECFVKISEAYHILSKPKLRSEYDRDISINGFRRQTRAKQYHPRPSEVYRAWEFKTAANVNPEPYYHIPGVKRQSNGVIAAALVIIGVFGCIFGFVSVRSSHSVHKKQLDETSIEANMHLQQVRANAEKYGNEEQIRRLVKRINLRADDGK